MGSISAWCKPKAPLTLLLDACQKQKRLGLVVFRGGQADLALPFTHSIEQAQKCLEELATWGRTPLPRTLQLAHEVIQRENFKHIQDAFLLVLIFDGKADSAWGPDPPWKIPWSWPANCGAWASTPWCWTPRTCSLISVAYSKWPKNSRGSITKSGISEPPKLWPASVSSWQGKFPAKC